MKPGKHRQVHYLGKASSLDCALLDLQAEILYQVDMYVSISPQRDQRMKAVILGTFISIKKYEKKKLEYLQLSLEPNGNTTGQPWIKNNLLFRLSREVRSTIIFVTNSEELIKIRDVEGYLRHTELSCLSIDRAFLHVEQVTNQQEQALIGIRRSNPQVDPHTGAEAMEEGSAATQQSLSDWMGLRARINITQWLEWL